MCWRRWRNARRSAGTSICRCSTRSDAVLKRMKRPGHARQLRAAARPHSHARARRRRCARPSSSASRARRMRISPNCRASSRRCSSTTSACFTYSHEEGTSAHALADDVPAGGEAAAADRRSCARRRQIVARGAERRASASGSDCSSTGRRLSTNSSCAPGWRARRPTSTRSSTSPTATRPSSPPARSSTPKSSGSRGYDLLARPVLGGPCVVRNCIRVIRLRVVT